ncbi:MAG: UDP-N-acetylmuramate dehydrogenase [Christensenellales bacterium]
MNTHELVDTLSQLKIQDIKINEPLKNHSNIKIGGNAKIFVLIKTQKQLKDCIVFLNAIKSQYFVLGNGTNTLFGDNGYDGVVISLGKSFKGYKIYDDGIFANAGLNLFELNKLCRQYGFAGLEFSYGIPGSVGGAVCMNAGAYGKSIGDFIDFCLVIKNGKLKKVKAKDMKFSYRHSIVNDEHLTVVGAKFNLLKGDAKQIENLQNEYFQKRLQNQPYSQPSLGSVFKRKDGTLPVSKMIDELGLKGHSVGGACVSEKHAGFIVNKGSATCQDVLKLIKYIQQKVKKVYGFEPELEIKILGE